MGARLDELKPVFCDQITRELEDGILYISMEYGTSIHLCACGCGKETVMLFSKESGGDRWVMINDGGKITFSPSVGNFSGENPYHAHYYIRENKIVWL